MLALAVFVVKDALGHSGSPAGVTWTTGQKLTSTDLNNTVAHLHNTFDGNIADENVSVSAAIQHTKMQYPALLPKAWARPTDGVSNSTGCTATCYITGSYGDGSRVTSVTRSGTGVYSVNLAYTATDTAYAVSITPYGSTAWCRVTSQSTTAVAVACFDNSIMTNAADKVFSIVVFDT
jgi:hypothetical protein